MTEGFENNFEVSGIDCGKGNEVRSSISSSSTDKNNSLPALQPHYFGFNFRGIISDNVFQSLNGTGFYPALFVLMMHTKAKPLYK